MNDIHDSVVTDNVREKPNKTKSIISLFVACMLLAGIGIGVSIVSIGNSSTDISYVAEEPPYHKIKFTVSDDDKDCRSDEDYFLVLKVENKGYKQLTAIDCLNGEIQADSWTISWGEGSSNDGGDTFSSSLGLRKYFDEWTTDEFYMLIAYLDDTDDRWKTACKTPTLENGYDVMAEYCGEWYA